jgi:hypothetical protein
MAFRVAYDTNFADRAPADQFQRYARSAATVLVIGALIAIALGLALGGLNIWEQTERLDDFGQDVGFRLQVLTFFQTFAPYGLIGSIMFAGGLLVSSLAWFQLALAADFDDLYDEATPDQATGDTPDDQ